MLNKLLAFDDRLFLVPPTIGRDNVEMSPRLPAGQTLQLLCDASGKPAPTLEWFWNNTKITTSTENLVLGTEGRYVQVSAIAISTYPTCRSTTSASSIAACTDAWRPTSPARTSSSLLSRSFVSVLRFNLLTLHRGLKSNLSEKLLFVHLKSLRQRKSRGQQNMINQNER